MDDDPDKKLLDAIRAALNRPVETIPGLERKPYRRGTYEAAQAKRDWKRRRYG